MFVWVMLNGEFAVRFFDLFRSGSARDSENLVVIFFCGHGLGGGWGCGDHAGRAE